MLSTTVQYITPSHVSKESKNTPRDIQVSYLKAAIVILALAFVTVSTILVWRLLASKNYCDDLQTSHEDKDSPALKSQIQTSNEKKTWQCPSVGKKKSLPYMLPYEVQRIFKDVKELLKKEIDKKTLVSLSCTAVYRNKQLWNAAYGVLEKSKVPGRAPNEDTLYKTGSLVKILTVLMTFKLLQEKKIDCLDDPLKKYSMVFSVENPFNQNDITIRQILSHTSGLPREVPCGPSFSSFRGTKICPVNTTYVYEKLKNSQLKFSPGTSVGYSNLGYAILAHSLFARFGGRYRSWQQWILNELLYPLGMTKTVLNSDRFYDNMASSYKANGILSPQLDWGWSAPSFQMLTSTADLSKLMLAILNPGTSFIDELITREMFKPEFVFPDLHTIFSSGWQIRYHNSIRVITKAGAVPGSSAAVILMPEQKFGFVLLATGQEIVPKLAEEISLKLSKIISTSLVSKSLKIRPSTNSRRYIGLYVLKNSWSDKVKATISFESFTGRLMLSQDPGYPTYVYLSFINSQLLQIVYPHGLSCQVYALGQDRENLKFKHPDKKGRFKQFTLGSFVFQRIDI